MSQLPKYLNVGLLPEQAVRSADLRYMIELLDEPGSALPRFESVAIEPLCKDRTDAFRKACSENRLKSLMHGWPPVEDLARDSRPTSPDCRRGWVAPPRK